MGSEARARLGLAGLLAATLLGFSRVFAEGDYPGPILLGMLAAIGLALATRRLGMSILTSSITSVGALLWYLMLIFEAKHTFFGLPTASAAGGLMRSIGRAYANSNIDYAPVPLRPGYIALAVTALWLLATLGEIATFRLRRSLLVTLASSSLFVFLLVVGRREGASFFAIVFLSALLCYLGLESAHRLRSWGHWITAWSSKKLYEPEVATGPLARRMGAASVAAALVAPFFLPAIGSGVLEWRNPTGGGFGPGSGQIDTLVSLAPRLIQQSKKVLFIVEATEPAYWRLITLTRFDGNSWHPETQRRTLAHQTVATDVRPPDPGRLVEQRYQIAGLGGDLVPAAPLPTVISFEGSNASEYEEDLEFNPVTADIELGRVLTEGVSYRVQSLVPDVTFDAMKKATVPSAHDFVRYPEDLPPYLTPDLFEVPPALCPPDGPDVDGQPDCDRLDEAQISRIAQRWSRGEETPYEKLVALQDKLRGFDHELPGRDDIPNDVDPKPSASADYLVEFLTKTKTGYCQQFATAFAVLARMLGYPARVSVGFLPGETRVEAPGTFTVRGNDAHAWPEVFFDEIGWVRFEPTPRSEAPPPLYTQVRPSGEGVPGSEIQGGSANAAAQREGNPQGFRNTLGEQGVPSRVQRQRNRLPEWRAAFFRLAAIVASLIILFLLAVPSLKAVLIRRRYLGAKNPTARIAAAFAEFESEAADLATPRALSESAAAFARRLAGVGSVPARPALRLAAIFEAAAYGPASTSWPNPEEAKSLARQLRRSLWTEAGWWNRVQRLFSPATLVAANGSVRLRGRIG